MPARSLLDRFKQGDPLSSANFVRDVKANPSEAAEVCSDSGNTLLHFICCGGDAPIKVVSALLAAYPEGAALADHDGNIPIVGAVSNGCDKEVIELLLEANEEGAHWTNADGQTLLHFAACNNTAHGIVQLLLDAWPGATRETDGEGNTPLHFAAACQADPEVVRLLIAAFPEAAQLAGRMQRLPLNLALLCKAHPESVKAIKDAFPGALYGQSIVPDHFNSGFGVSKHKEGDPNGVCQYCRGSVLRCSGGDTCPLRQADEKAGRKNAIVDRWSLKNLWK